MRSRKIASGKKAAIEIVLRPDAAPQVQSPAEPGSNGNGKSHGADVDSRDYMPTCEHCASIKPVLTELIESVQKLHDQIRATASGEKEWLTTAEFALAVGLSEFTIRKQCREGGLNGVKVGRGKGLGRWRLPHEELLRFEREHYEE